jgi:hypothetical protein
VDSTAQVEPFVDADTVAAHLKVTRRQVLEMTRRCLLPGHPLGVGTSRRIWRYKLSEIDAIVTGESKKSPEPAFPCNAVSSTMSAGSPRNSQRRRL